MYLLDVIDTKFYKRVNKPKRTHPKNVCVVDFVNKGIDAIHLSKIFHATNVVKLLPEQLRTDDNTPVIAFKLQRPIRSKIFNYRQTILEIDFQHDEEVGFLNNNYPCDCSSSEYRDPFHEHILTGDLRIIKDNKLKELFSKGPNYRENLTTNFGRCGRSIKENITNFIEKMANKLRNTGAHR